MIIFWCLAEFNWFLTVTGVLGQIHFNYHLFETYKQRQPIFAIACQIRISDVVFFIVRKRLTLALYKNNDIGSFLLLFQLKSEIKANKVQDLMNQC